MPGARGAARFERLRGIRTTLYALISAAGVLSVVNPPNVLLNAAEQGATLVCSLLWAVGGLVSLVSAARRTMWGEWVMLRPMAFGMFTFAFALGSQVNEVGAPILAYSFILTAMGLSLWGWWCIVDGLIGVAPQTKGDG